MAEEHVMSCSWSMRALTALSRLPERCDLKWRVASNGLTRKWASCETEIPTQGRWDVGPMSASWLTLMASFWLKP